MLSTLGLVIVISSIVWAFHTFRDAEERRDRAASNDIFNAQALTLSARQEAITAKTETLQAYTAAFTAATLAQKERDSWNDERRLNDQMVADYRKKANDAHEKLDAELHKARMEVQQAVAQRDCANAKTFSMRAHLAQMGYRVEDVDDLSVRVLKNDAT